jgi:DNA gyrase/topoisomerase IV subunit A
MVPVVDFGAALGSAESERDVVMLTRNGQIKRTPLKQFASINRNGLAAMGVRVSAGPCTCTMVCKCLAGVHWAAAASDSKGSSFKWCQQWVYLPMALLCLPA